MLQKYYYNEVGNSWIVDAQQKIMLWCDEIEILLIFIAVFWFIAVENDAS